MQPHPCPFSLKRRRGRTNSDSTFPLLVEERDRVRSGTELMNKIFNQKIQKEKRRSLRRRSTKAERTLWQNLRNRGFEGYKFRRQFSVGFFVLDFYCPELKLAIEVDGYSHDSEEAKKYDTERQKIIEVYGVRFLRIRDEEVHEDIEKALKKIKTEILKRIDNDKKI